MAPVKAGPSREPIVHSERVVYDNRWVKVGLADIEHASGTRLAHHTVTFPEVAMVVVLDEARAHVLMAWRYRFAPGIWGWELPGGVIEPGESPRQAVVRELREETGYRPTRLDPLLMFEPAVGMLRNRNHLFVAHGVQPEGDPTEMDEGRFEWVPYRDVLGLIDQGKVTSSGALIGLLRCLVR
jgi:8-oxo-dGTP pyrophosphatase MutT (NUDIX family)